MEAGITKKELSLYVHIPFCIKKCNYCDFLSSAADENTREAYVEALLSEIESYRDSELSRREITSIFIGGGTPSILSERQIQNVCDKIKSVFNNISSASGCQKNGEACEISIEINPGTVTGSKCELYRELGINRVSIGLQSVHDEELKTLGRIHDYRQFLQSYEMLRAAGMKNINIDLMSALPGQSVDSYCEGLERIIALKPEHISAYSLIVEEGTLFYDMYNNRRDLLPDEDSERLMYYQTKELLKEFNYGRYEISNYALPGYECRHNKVYWQRGEYLGFGLGSASFVNHTRFRNTEKMEEYIHQCNMLLRKNDEEIPRVLHRDVQTLTCTEEMEEFMFLGLRMMEGVSFSEFEKQFGKSICQVYGKIIDKYEKTGFLRIYTKDSTKDFTKESENAFTENSGQENLSKSMPESGISTEERKKGTDSFLALTDKGIDVSNSIFEEFLLS